MSQDKWIVDIKGAPNQNTFEISVLRESNTHGQNSYGWFGDDKLLISHDGGPCHIPVTDMVWNELVEVAHRVARKLNGELE